MGTGHVIPVYHWMAFGCGLVRAGSLLETACGGGGGGGDKVRSEPVLDTFIFPLNAGSVKRMSLVPNWGTGTCGDLGGTETSARRFTGAGDSRWGTSAMRTTEDSGGGEGSEVARLIVPSLRSSA